MKTHLRQCFTTIQRVGIGGGGGDKEGACSDHSIYTRTNSEFSIAVRPVL